MQTEYDCIWQIILWGHYFDNSQNFYFDHHSFSFFNSEWILRGSNHLANKTLAPFDGVG